MFIVVIMFPVFNFVITPNKFADHKTGHLVPIAPWEFSCRQESLSKAVAAPKGSNQYSESSMLRVPEKFIQSAT